MIAQEGEAGRERLQRRGWQAFQRVIFMTKRNRSLKLVERPVSMNPPDGEMNGGIGCCQGCAYCDAATLVGDVTALSLITLVSPALYLE